MTIEKPIYEIPSGDENHPGYIDPREWENILRTIPVSEMVKEKSKQINKDSVVWQKIETEYWIKYVKSLIQEHYSETNSELSKKIIDNFKNEILNFVQVCPKEMIDKLENPISLKPMIKEVS